MGLVFRRSGAGFLAAFSRCVVHYRLRSLSINPTTAAEWVSSMP
jgi:hypothetical protein